MTCKNPKCNEVVTPRIHGGGNPKLYCCRKCGVYHRRDLNRDKFRETCNKSYNKNKHKYTERKRKAYYDYKERRNFLARKRTATDPLHRLKHNIRVGIGDWIRTKGKKKLKKTEEYLGCPFIEVKKHLENQFTHKMSWENYGTYWHVDHIVPLSWAKCEEELFILSHYSNLQPLTTKENLAKGARYIC